MVGDTAPFLSIFLVVLVFPPARDGSPFHKSIDPNSQVHINPRLGLYSCIAMAMVPAGHTATVPERLGCRLVLLHGLTRR
jgi:hypothetical protein